MTFKYLHAVGVSTFWLDHKLTPEVRAMLAAMASRAPLGGVQARYAQIVEAVGQSLFEEKRARLAEDNPDGEIMTWEQLPEAHGWLGIAEDRLCDYPLHPKVQKFFDDFVGKYGHSSILELVGQPTVYVEGVSWLTAWLTFDSPLCAGQEFSTRAVQHKDWPMARECEEVDVGATSILQAEDERILRQVAGQDIDLSDYKAPPILTPNRDLVRLHNDWFEVFEAEVAWWKAEFTSACPTCKGKGEYVRPGESYATHGITAGMPMTCEQCEGTGKKYPTADKEPFRPALDRARWALPGTIATGCAHTSNLRERARVIRDGSNLASLSGAVATKAVWDEIAAAYRLALPGMAGMGLREAVYTPGTNIPGHLRSILSSTDEGPDVELSVRYTGGIVGLQGYARTSEKSYMDAVENSRARVNVGFRCSLAVARDWHRHRTMFPWYLQVVRDNHGTPEPGPIQIDHHYGPMSDLAKAKTPGLLARSTNVFDYHMSSQNRMQAALALPLGTRVRLRGQGGLRDAVYMLSLRHTAVGANFEYKEQAGKALDILDAELKKGVVPV